MNKKTLTIGEFNDSFMPVMDGVSNVCKNYTIEMNNLGHKAYAIVPSYKDSVEYDKLHNIDYAIRGKEFCPISAIKPYGITVFPPETKKIISSIPFDIVHAHCPIFTGKYALKIAKKRDIPIVTTFHTFFKDDLDELIPPLFVETIIKQMMNFYYCCDEVWTPSFGSKKKIEQEYHYDRPIRVVENGCDMTPPSSYNEYLEKRKKGVEVCNCGENIPIFIYVGQLKDEKNIPLTLNAIKLLKNKIGSGRFKMIFVGEGHKKEDYEKFVLSNNLQDVITFLGRISEREVIASLYCASFLFLFPSLYDTSCLVMREAAAFNLPLVYIEGACTSEGINDGGNGFLIKNNPEDFASKLEYLINHPERQKQAGEGARKDLFRSWHDVSEEVETLYYEIIEKKKKNY